MTEKIDAFASQPQYVEHIAPIWRGLPDEMRGTFQATGLAGHRANQLGLQLGVLHRDRNAATPLTIVASYLDEMYVRPRPVVLVEHGAGQSYGHDATGGHHPAYPGGSSRDAVCLFLCPNESTAQRWRDMYPDTPTAVVGCPYLDPWHQSERLHEVGGYQKLPVVVFSFHWDCAVVPECGSAFGYYQQELVRLSKMTAEERGFHMVGHAHPRADEVKLFWRKWDVRYMDRFAEVLDYADCYVADNTSTLFEFASTGRPVVVLNCPEYRRDVEHGGRFWNWATVGHQVDDPQYLLADVRTVARGVQGPDGVRLDEARRRVVEQVYAYTDGHATDRAVAAILQTYDEGHWRAWREQRVAHDPFAPTGATALTGLRALIVRKLREQDRALEADLAERLQHASEQDLQLILANL